MRFFRLIKLWLASLDYPIAFLCVFSFCAGYLVGFYWLGVIF